MTVASHLTLWKQATHAGLDLKALLMVAISPVDNQKQAGCVGMPANGPGQ